jgi:hypothetical protein
LSQPPPRQVGAEEVRTTLTEVLSRPEFQVPEPGPIALLLARISDALRELVLALVRRIPLPELGGSALPWLIRGALALAAVLLILHVVRALARREPPTFRRRAAGASVVPASPEPDWYALAERAAGSGRFPQAALALYQALLTRLRDRGLIRLDPAKTPGDYRRELRGHPAVAGAMDRFLAAFEPMVFGGRAADREAFERIRERARETADG